MLKGTPGELASGDMLITVELKKQKKNTWLLLFFLLALIYSLVEKSDILKS